MSNDGGSINEDSFAVVREVLADPGSATGSVPALLGLIDEEAASVRLSGALGLCLVAVANPDSVPSIVTRLNDRMDGDSRPEARVAYDYLASQFPRRVNEAIREYDGVAGGPTGPAGRPDDATDPHDGVGRVRPPGVEYDPRAVEPDRNVIDPEDPQRQPDDQETPSVRSDGPDVERGDRNEPSPGRGQPGTAKRQQWNQLYERLSTIVGYSRFDDLMVLSGRTKDRYADISRVLAVEGSAERALALRLFHCPPEDPTAFSEDLEDALAQWQAIGDHSNVVSVFDVGSRPEPWVATEPIVETLADRAGPFEPAVAVSLAFDLTDAVAYAHQHGVIHGGLDPENVAVTMTGEGVPAAAALDNVGLLAVYRWYVTPATCLDPRYAAPEYYDRRFGRIDHATDIYHLGAVLYRLLTGRPPIDGTFEEIRESILHDEPPEPSEQTDIPDGLDRIVTKSMGKHTLRRYETINDLRGDLDRVQEELNADGS